jgi:hypothetical protein
LIVKGALAKFTGRFLCHSERAAQGGEAKNLPRCFESRFSDEKGEILRHFSRFAAFVPQNDVSKIASYHSSDRKRSFQALKFRKLL